MRELPLHPDVKFLLERKLVSTEPWGPLCPWFINPHSYETKIVFPGSMPSRLGALFAGYQGTDTSACFLLEGENAGRIVFTEAVGSSIMGSSIMFVADCGSVWDWVKAAIDHVVEFFETK